MEPVLGSFMHWLVSASEPTCQQIPSQASLRAISRKTGDGQQWAIPNKPREHSFMTHKLLGRLQDYENGEGRSHKSLNLCKSIRLQFSLLTWESNELYNHQIKSLQGNRLKALKVGKASLSCCQFDELGSLREMWCSASRCMPWTQPVSHSFDLPSKDNRNSPSIDALVCFGASNPSSKRFKIQIDPGYPNLSHLACLVWHKCQ